MVQVMADRLRTALGRGELRLVYQPLVSLSDGSIEAFEALLRWTHRGATVPLEVYIPIAEETGLIHRIGEWVLNTACQQAHQLNQAYPGRLPLKVHVNVSAHQLNIDGWHNQVTTALTATSLPPENLVLELTEGRPAGDGSRMRRQLMDTAMLGVEIAVDAFGAEYSSLAYLPQLPLHVIKLDRLFVLRLGEDPVAEALTRSLRQLTWDLRIRCIAEGVETAAQAQALLAMGYSQAQGYLFSRPLEYDAILGDLAAVELATSTAAAEIAAHHRVNGPIRALVVDGDPAALDQTRRLLEQYADFQVDAVGDVEEAVELVRQNKPVDLVIIGLLTQPSAGIRLARAVRSTCRGRAIPVLAVAGPADQLASTPDALLFDQVISGPVDRKGFAATVRGWVKTRGTQSLPTEQVRSRPAVLGVPARLDG